MRARTPLLCCSRPRLLVRGCRRLRAGPPTTARKGSRRRRDVADIRGVRAQIEIGCPCASFDGTSSATNKSAFGRCAKGVVLDASDGTADRRTDLASPGVRSDRASSRPAVGLRHFQPPTTAIRAASIARSGRSRGAIKRTMACVSSSNRRPETPAPGFHFLADACSGNALNTCNVIGPTLSITSAAAPPNTPGTAGVTVTNPKLLTQFGGSFSLNKRDVHTVSS